jgi:hypothetical protein
MVAEKAKGEVGQALKEAHKQVEDEGDEHLYHTAGWSRELRIQTLGADSIGTNVEQVAKLETATRRPHSIIFTGIPIAHRSSGGRPIAKWNGRNPPAGR